MLGLAGVGTSHADTEGWHGLQSPQVQRVLVCALLGPSGWGLRAGLLALLSLGLQLECGWPMLVLCLMLYLLKKDFFSSSCTFIKTDHILYI